MPGLHTHEGHRVGTGSDGSSGLSPLSRWTCAPGSHEDRAVLTMMYAHHLGVVGKWGLQSSCGGSEEGRERGCSPGWRVPADSPRVPCLPQGRARRTKPASCDTDSVQGGQCAGAHGPSLKACVLPHPLQGGHKLCQLKAVTYPWWAKKSHVQA